MRIFLILLAVLAVVAAGAWYYVDHTMRYVPEDMETMRPLKDEPYLDKARVVKKRLSRELKSTGRATISADDIETVMMAAIGKKSTIPVDELIRSYKVAIHDDAVEAAFVVDLTRVEELKLPKKARKGLALIRDLVPDDMLDNVYIAVRGLPQKIGDRVVFSENSEVQIGGFSRKINDLMADARLVLGRDVLQKLQFDTFEIRDGRVIVQMDR